MLRGFEQGVGQSRPRRTPAGGNPVREVPGLHAGVAKPLACILTDSAASGLPVNAWCDSVKVTENSLIVLLS